MIFCMSICFTYNTWEYERTHRINDVVRTNHIAWEIGQTQINTGSTTEPELVGVSEYLP